MFCPGGPHTLAEERPQSGSNSAIQPLPASVAAQIKSAAVITDVADVVVGLLENALDTRSTTISISVDLVRRACIIEDNGFGIHPGSFRENGGLCKVHHSSKLDRRTHVHGGQGVFLASLSTLSLLSIVSKHASHHSVNSLLMHRGELLSKKNPRPTPARLASPSSHGTIINARDIFGNLPVRVKQRAQIMDNKSQADKEWTDVSKRVAALVMAWPFRISVTLENRQDTSKRIHLPGDKAKGTETNDDYLQELSVQSKIKRSTSVFSAFRFLPGILASTLISASVATSSYSVVGVISTSPGPTPELQFISVGIKPVPRISEGKDLYDAVNQAFAKSSFGTTLSTIQGADDRDFRRSLRVKDVRVRKESLDRWPVFYLNIELNGSRENEHESLAAAPESICHLLKALAEGWLRANGFQPSHSESRQNTPSPRPCDRVPDTTQRLHHFTSASPMPALANFALASNGFYEGSSDTAKSLKRRLSVHSVSSERGRSFSQWSRIKGGSPKLQADLWTPLTGDKLSSLVQSQSQAIDGTTLRTEYSSSGSVNPHSTKSPRPKGDARHASQSDLVHDCCSDFFVWEDPDTTKPVAISSRTGMLSSSCDLRNNQNQSYAKVARPTLQNVKLPSVSGGGEPWLSNVLETWVNPVFVPENGGSTCFLNNDSAQGIKNQSAAMSSSHGADIEWTMQSHRSPVQLSKHGLASAKVIAQVDRKYILIRVPIAPASEPQSSQKSILALVDQHAASERCTLESLFATLSDKIAHPLPISSVDGSPPGLHTSPMTKPLHFSITGSEAELMNMQAGHFAAWGILYDLKPERSSDDTSYTGNDERTVAVTHLPPTIAERCVQEPRLLIELIREDIYSFDRSAARRGLGSNAFGEEQKADDTSPAWLKRLGSCPKGMIEMLHSRACRSAIMFNDELSLEECKKLVTELSGCVFPFTCAHGRVSMVPLLTMDGCQVSDTTSVDKTTSSCFPEAFEQWQQNTE